MRHTFAGLGASREEVEAVFMRDRTRESLIVRPYESRGNYDMAQGRFRWDAKNVFFDFYGQGKLRTITLLRSEVDDGRDSPDHEGDDGYYEGSFAPAEARWRGRLTLTPGTAHRTVTGGQTKMWERAAWNTINEWCRPKLSAGVMPAVRVVDVWVPLVEVMNAASKAWARVTNDAQVIWFLPHENGARREIVAEGGADSIRVYQKFFIVQAAVAMRRATVSEPGWWDLKATSQEQLNYLAVAYDQFEESGGKSFAPLQGLNLKLTKRKR